MEKSLRVLMLEDNKDDAELVEFELQEAGFDYISTRVLTEKDYRRALREFAPDIILSDYDLPTYNGARALAAARAECPNVPFILVTGAISEERAIDTLTSGAKDYVMKTRLHRLAPAIKRALAEAEEHKARRKAEGELLAAKANLEFLVEERTIQLQKELNERKKVEETLTVSKTRQEILFYTAGRLLASDNPQELVEELCLKVMEFLDCQAFFNFLADDAAGRLHLNACAGISPEKKREIEWLDYGIAVCGCAARDGCRIVAERIQETPDVRTELVKSFGIMAYACHPLMERGRTIGTLSFGTRTRDTFSNDDLEMMKAVADQVAMAMARIGTERALGCAAQKYSALFNST
jgi:DNA-binding response OmpR family regulator